MCWQSSAEKQLHSGQEEQAKHSDGEFLADRITGLEWTALESIGRHEGVLQW